MTNCKKSVFLLLISGGVLFSGVVRGDEERSWLDLIISIFSSSNKPKQNNPADQTNTPADSNASLFQGKFAVGLQDHWKGVGFTISSSDPVNFPWQKLLPKYCKRAWYAWNFTNDASGAGQASPMCLIPLTVKADDKTTLVIGDIVKLQEGTSVQICKRMIQELITQERARKQFSKITFEVKQASVSVSAGLLTFDTTSSAELIKIMSQLGFKYSADRRFLVRNL